MKITKEQLKKLIKEEIKKAKPDFFVLDGNYLFAYDQLRKLLELVVATTYPQSTLDRRIRLLTPREYMIVTKLLSRINQSVEKIDEIISERAERSKDPWP